MAKSKTKQQSPESETAAPVDLAVENVKLETVIAKLQTQLKEAQSVKSPVNIKGFLLEVGNPFGDGVIRAYRKAGGKSNQPDRLPFVLPDKEAASKEALKNYILRADAAGDKIRVAEARKAIA